MIFLKSDSLGLQNGGYLIGAGKPVTNKKFVEEQEKAHKAIVLASVLKTKNFKEVRPDSFVDALRETEQLLETSQLRTYQDKSTVNTPMMSELKREALAWLQNEGKANNTDKLNSVMQQFNTIADFEEFGLYFEEGVTKLHNIYTIDQILEAYKLIVEHV